MGGYIVTTPTPFRRFYGQKLYVHAEKNDIVKGTKLTPHSKEHNETFYHWLGTAFHRDLESVQDIVATQKLYVLIGKIILESPEALGRVFILPPAFPSIVG